MKPTLNIESHTLNEAWRMACEATYKHGQELNIDGSRQRELINLSIFIANGFETEHDTYFSYFGHDAYNQVMRVYTKGGDRELKKDYWTRIYDNNGINQVNKVIDSLKIDPTTKSATIILSDLNSEKLPCVMDVNFKIRNEKLEMTVVFKSSDIAKKFIPDIAVLTRIHEEISQQLHVARGSVTAFILSAQIHGKDFVKIKNLLNDAFTDHYYDTDAIIENWNGDAEQWDKKVKDPSHYVNIEDGYNRFISFTKGTCKDHITKNQVVLDLGCGTGIIADLLQKYSNNVYGIDIADKMIDVARKKPISAEFLLGNCLDIPFADEFFNAIVTRGVLISHVEKDYALKFIQESKRVLKPGGLFVFDFITHYNQSEKEKLKRKATFDQQSLSKVLEKDGFKIIEFSGAKSNRVNSVACIKE